MAVGQARGGSTLTENSNGTTWTVQPSAGGSFWDKASCFSTAVCLAAGQDASGQIVVDIWDGTSWTALPQPVPQFNAIHPYATAFSCSAADACTIVVNTYFESAFQPSSVGVLAFRWNGATWATQKIQLPADEEVRTIGGVACPSANSCTAVGFVTISGSNGNSYEQVLLERWDGSTWSAQPSSYPLRSDGSVPLLDSVSCASTTTCTAVGERPVTMPDGNVNRGNEYSVPYVLSYS